MNINGCIMVNRHMTINRNFICKDFSIILLSSIVLLSVRNQFIQRATVLMQEREYSCESRWCHEFTTFFVPSRLFGENITCYLSFCFSFSLFLILKTTEFAHMTHIKFIFNQFFFLHIKVYNNYSLSKQCYWA